MPTETKICNKCGIEQSVDEFYPRWRKGRASDLQARCSTCLGAGVKVYRDKDRPKWRKINRDSWQRVRSIVLTAYGNKCNCPGCEVTEPHFLALDHVDGGGKKHREKFGTIGIYMDVIRRGFPSEFQLLCHNCNQAKGYYGECPHAQVNRDKEEL